MSVLQELRDHFSELITPFATNECLEQLFQKLNKEIITKSEERLMKQNRKIEELEECVSFQENKIHQFLIKCDDNEQYSQSNRLWIHGNESKINKK